MAAPDPRHEPPKRWMRFLKWFCDDRFWEEIEGDIYEWFYDEVEQHGVRHARRAFFRQYFSYLRLYFLRRKSSIHHPIITRAMLLNYLKVVLRNFKKHKWYAGLNLLGLSVGFTAFILIQVYLHYQTHYESFHSKADRIYRPTYLFDNGADFRVQWARVPVDWINRLPEELPEIEQLIRFQSQDRKYVRVGREKFKPDHAFTTDKEVFEVFDFKLLEGNPATALAEPYSVVLTEKLARQYFGNTAPMGKEIFVTGSYSTEEQPYRVTGIMEDLPGNTHLPVELLLSLRDSSERTGWAYVYTLLREGASIESVNEKRTAFIQNQVSAEEAADLDLEFQAMPDIHLHSNLAREIVPNGNAIYVRIFSFVAYFILIIAFINFINLNSALSVGRAREIGVRKILGARKAHNIGYAFTESTSYMLLALGIGTVFAVGVFPYFRALTEVELTINRFWFGGLMILLAVVGGFLSGLYPASVLNSLNLASAMKSPKVLGLNRYKINIKRLLVGLQFVASIVLIGGALVGFRQMKYIERKNLGFSKAQILAMPDVPDAVTAGYTGFREAIKAIPGVQQVAACMQTPSEEIRDSGPVVVEGRNTADEEPPLLDMQIIDSEFIDLMDIELLAGQVPTHQFVFKPVPEFTDEFTPQDYLGGQSRSYLINETAMHQLGWNTPEEAVGKKINWSIGSFQLATGPIAGVVRDFHQESLKNKIDPLVMTFEPIWLRSFLVKVDADQLPAILPQMKTAWEDRFPQYPFEYHFLDEMFDRLYRSERLQIQLLSLFSILSIFIAALGLLSLVAFNLQTRLKEIAIRKVLGAELPALIGLIGREYIWIVLISGIIAIPLSYYGMQNWMQTFAYQAGISPMSYLFTLLIISVILVLIIGWQTFRSTRTNPVEYLKQE